MNLAKEKDIAMKHMQDKAKEALGKSEAICLNLQTELDKLVTDHAEVIKDKNLKLDDTNKLVNYRLEAKAYRKLITHGEKQYLKEWNAVNQRISLLTDDMKSRFKQEKNIRQADRLLENHRKYQEAVLRYLDTESDADKKG